MACDSTVGGSAASVLGCATADTITVTGNAVVEGDVEGAGNRDIIQVTGQAIVRGIVHGGAAGSDASAASDAGDLITINTTGTVGGVQGNLGDDQIWVLGGTVQGNVEGNEGNDTIVLNGPNAVVRGAIEGGTGNDVIALFEGQVDRVLAGAGDDEASWDAGKVKVARIDMGTGSDRLTVTNGAGGLGSTVLDGGDAATPAGGADTLTLDGVKHTAQAGQFLNWDVINLRNSTLAASDTLTARQDVFLTEGSTLNGLKNLTLASNLHIDATSSFVGHGAGAGSYLVTGNLANAGTVNLLDRVAGDRLRVGGNYTGGGVLAVDVDFARAASDVMAVNGSVTGPSTAVVVNDASTVGVFWGQEVTVVTADGGIASGALRLANGPITKGVWNYDLVTRPNQAVLSGKVNSIGAAYEGAPSVLLNSFASLPTLEQRVGQRQWISRNESGGSQIEGLWFRVSGDRDELRPEHSRSGYNSKATTTTVQAGVDLVTGRSDSGYWVVGATGQYGRVNSTLNNAAGRAKVEGSGYGVGLTASWHGAQGTYVDSQLQVNRVSMDVSSDGHGTLVDGQHRTALAAGVEVGHHIDIGERKHWLVPQAQLSYGRMGGSQFTDRRLNTVNFGSADQLIGRVGVAYQYRPSGELRNSGADGKMVYVIGNILRDFASENSVTVSGTTLAPKGQRTWAEVGVGGSLQLAKGTMLYGEAAYRTAVGGGSSGNKGLSANMGVRVSW